MQFSNTKQRGIYVVLFKQVKIWCILILMTSNAFIVIYLQTSHWIIHFSEEFIAHYCPFILSATIYKIFFCNCENLIMLARTCLNGLFSKCPTEISMSIVTQQAIGESRHILCTKLPFTCRIYHYLKTFKMYLKCSKKNFTLKKNHAYL